MLATPKKEFKKLLFNQDITEQPSDEVSQKKVSVEVGGEELPNREITQKKLVRNNLVFNLPITHIHKPPIDARTIRRTLEIRESYKLHVQNLKKKMKINPHATIVLFIVMVDPVECATIEEFYVRKHDQYNYFVMVDHIQSKHEGS